ncbi:O-sialoglycoprotein endopeptidase/protein kinase, partial [mine drainage metagenome]
MAIIMEKIDGKLLGKCLDEETISPRILDMLGKEVGKMHEAGISHGDLNPNNILLSNNSVFLIDPSMGSLSPGVEELAADIKMVSDFLKGHSFSEIPYFKSFIDSYSSLSSRWKEIDSILYE